MGFEQEHMDVLQNIEAAIVREFRADSSILDLNADDAVSALVRLYEAEQQQRTPSQLRLSDRSRKIFDAVHPIMEWRLGRAAGPLPVDEHPEMDEPLKPKTLAEIIACLKTIRKSIGRWTKVGGRQGYLSFVAQYV